MVVHGAAVAADAAVDAADAVAAAEAAAASPGEVDWVAVAMKKMKEDKGGTYEGTVIALCEELRGGRRDPWGTDLVELRQALEGQGCRVVPRPDNRVPASTISETFYPTIGIRCMDEDVRVLRECATRAKQRSALWAKVDMDIALKCLKGLTYDVAELAARHAKLAATVDQKEAKAARLASENEFLRKQVQQMLEDLEKSADPEYVKVIVRTRKLEAEQEAQRRLCRRWDDLAAATEGMHVLNNERLELISAREQLEVAAVAAAVLCAATAKTPPAMMDPTLHEEILDLPLPLWPGAVHSEAPPHPPVVDFHVQRPASAAPASSIAQRAGPPQELNPLLLAESPAGPQQRSASATPSTVAQGPPAGMLHDSAVSVGSPGLSAISACGVHQTPLMMGIDAAFPSGGGAGSALPVAPVTSADLRALTTPTATAQYSMQPHRASRASLHSLGGYRGGNSPTSPGASRVDVSGPQMLGSFLEASEAFQKHVTEADRRQTRLEYDIDDVTSTVYVRSGIRMVRPCDESQTFWGGILEAFQYRSGRYDLKVDPTDFHRPQQVAFVEQQSRIYKLERLHKHMLRHVEPCVRIGDINYSTAVQAEMETGHAERIAMANKKNRLAPPLPQEDIVAMAKDPLLNAQDWVLHQDRPTAAQHEVEPTSIAHDENCYYRKYYKVVRGCLPAAVRSDIRKEMVKKVQFDATLTKRFRQPGIIAALAGPDVANPFLDGIIDCQTSSVACPPAALSAVGSSAMLVEDRPIPFFATKNVPDQWVLIDLMSVVVIPQAYSFASVQPITAGGFPRNWRLEGSLDKVTWTILRRHVNDDSFSKHTPFATWTLDCVEAAKAQPLGYYFRYLRVVSEGPNHSGAHELQMSCFEVYGRVLRAQEYAPDREILRSVTERRAPPRIARYDLRMPDEPFQVPDKKKKGKKGAKKGARRR